MNKPTKGQLADAVIHYQTELDTLLSGPALDAEDLLEEIKRIRVSQPSLRPVAKVVDEAPAVEQTAETTEAQ